MDKPESPPQPPLMFSPSRHLTVDEAALLAHQVLARAQAALRNGPPPQGAQPADPPPAAQPSAAVTARGEPGPILCRFECWLIASAVLACLIVVLIQRVG